MLAHAPALTVLVPLLAAPLSLVFVKSRHCWIFCLLVTCASLVLSSLMLGQILDTGTIIYTMGGWPAPWGIEYRVDLLNGFVLLLVSLLGFIVMMAADSSLEKEIDTDKRKFFYSSYLLCLTGMLGITATGDAFNVFVFLEISSLSTYTLIAMGKDRKALWASYQYLIMGTIGATFILIGIGLMYAMTGTLNMHDLSIRLPEVENTRTVFTAFAFFMVGVCLKLALFPLHLWLPNAYTYAPSIVSALIAATATKVAVYVMLRFVFTIFGIEFSFEHMPLQEVLIALGVAGVLTSSIIAIYQTNLKRLAAYSSVAQVGYMIIGFAIGNVTGLTATILHLFNHALMKGALFLAMAGIMYRLGHVEIKNLQGLGRTMPLTMAAFVVGGLSLIGVPLTVGFVSKWYLVLGIIEQGWWLLAVLVLFGSLLALIYIWRVIEIAYFSPPNASTSQVSEAPAMILIPTWILVLGNIYFGIDTDLTVGITSLAAQSLFGVSP
ncbi:MAG: monovalent cation/H+ antiporter subunit D family protein [Gammaproteobacteria bacterium]|nr:monovalent cation/H+ antiporter subunit D family protein [Gammaproteobacteria bacterium]